MKQRANLALLALCCTLGPASTAFAEGGHWSYEGHAGPAAWASISPEFSACKLGGLQSPIDIRAAKVADLPAITFDYKPSPLTIIDNGHTIQVNYAPGSSIAVGGARYELVQFHFHRPSEERINGKAHAMVVHLVHRDAAGKLAVVAVLLDKGGSSELIDTLWKNIPKEKEREAAAAGVSVDASALLPKDHRYYTFQGSLTTPPCSEGVTWFVLRSPLKIADAQTAAFGRIYAHNARPVQPLHGRLIQTTN
ncbi:MAG: carbonic anhydrase family protein [Burkholderiales bacterium]|nr:carbonic anhydrase family protein [Burkholderiales bacterium]